MRPNAMVRCNGCGFHVEQYDVVTPMENTDELCEECAKCRATPALRESYRRGFNAGQEELADEVRRVIEARGRR